MTWLGKLFGLLTKGARRINDYFRNATKVYALQGDESSRLAALAAAKVAAGEQRRSMVAYIRGMALDSRNESETAEIRRRLEQLADDISAKDLSLADIREAKVALGKASPEYLSALNKFDAQVFVRKWPALFLDEAIEPLRAKLTESGPLPPDQEAILQSPGKLRDVLEIPHEAMEIVGAYGAVLADDVRMLKPLSILPYPKATIDSALRTALEHAHEPDVRQSLETGFDSLKDFIPDECVPSDPEENAKAWFLHRAGRWPCPPTRQP